MKPAKTGEAFKSLISDPALKNPGVQTVSSYSDCDGILQCVCPSRNLKRARRNSKEEGNAIE